MGCLVLSQTNMGLDPRRICAGCSKMKPVVKTEGKKLHWFNKEATKRNGCYDICSYCYRLHCNTHVCAGCLKMKPVEKTEGKKLHWFNTEATKRNGSYDVCRNCSRKSHDKQRSCPTTAVKSTAARRR